MRLVLFVLWIGSLVSFGVAQSEPSATSSSKTPATKPSKQMEPVSSDRLLQRAYLLSKELPPEERVWLLTEIIMPSAKWHPALMRPWTDEVFRMALQLSPGYDRVVSQKNAATAMAWVNIDRALQMLDQCETPSPTDSDTEDVRTVAARTIFNRVPECPAWHGFGGRRITLATPENIRMGRCNRSSVK